MDFSKALVALKLGEKIRRDCWEHTYLEISKEQSPATSHPIIYLCESAFPGMTFRTVYGPTQNELFADDWEVIEEKSETAKKFEEISEHLRESLDEDELKLVKELLDLFLN